MQINFYFWPIGNTYQSQNALRTNLEGLLLKLIAKDLSVTLFVGTPGGGQIPYPNLFDPQWLSSHLPKNIKGLTNTLMCIQYASHVI
jgi:hypothetical protein